MPFLHLSAADPTWYLNMSTGCSSEDVPLDDAAAAAMDAEVWSAVRSNKELWGHALSIKQGPAKGESPMM